MKKRVLVIDDEAEIRRNLTFGLTAEGYTVTACPDGISAVHELNRSRAAEEAYDYLVTDIFMPDIDGLKILKVIKGQFPELPVVVITGFGDDGLKLTALAEHNTEYLDKPFEITDLVAAFEKLAPGATTLTPEVEVEGDDTDEGPRESISAYLTIRITEPERSMEIFNALNALDGVKACDAVRGDVDIILLAQAESREGVEAFFDQVRALDGVEVASASPVERPKLDRDIDDFVSLYKKAVKAGAAEAREPSATSYVIIDIDRHALQEIFTTVFFIDDLIFCDVVSGGDKLVGMITGGAVGRTPRILEKITHIDGVLRVREAKVIRMLDD